MCGFVGVRRLDGTSVDPGLLAGLADRLAHRGPDGHGLWTGDGVGLAHRRLAIIDLAGSPQPLHSADGLAHVAFNGEILNYRELRRTLDYPYSTDGDTEVLLALHRVRGPLAVEELRGQFAYALHDDTDGTTWLVRDRLGIIPLFVLQTDGFVAFASEAKALLPLVPGGARVDEASLDAYLRGRAVPGPHTLFVGITKLLPGHVMSIDAGGTVATRRYWSPPPATEVRLLSDRQAIDAVSAALTASIDANLVSDAPVGTYLSGGLDSSLITALVAHRHGPGVPTFAAGFGDDRFDELPHARAVSEHLRTDHVEVQIRPEDFTSTWEKLTWHRDAPLSEPADLAVHALAVAAGERVKVVLSGEGSDELFGGYPKHRFARATAGARYVPHGLRRMAATGMSCLPPQPTLDRMSIAARALGARNDADRLAAWFSPFTEAERAGLLAPTPPSRPLPGPTFADGDALRRMLLADLDGWLPDNLLERGDRMTMAASVELRPPFLDHRLVELAFHLPSSVKVRRGSGKWVIKEVARPLLPAGIVDRPKLGFKVPLDVWFRHGLRDLAWDRLLSPSSFVTSVFDRSAVRAVLEQHDSGRRDEAIRIWTLLGLELWHSTCLTGVESVGRPSR